MPVVGDEDADVVVINIDNARTYLFLGYLNDLYMATEDVVNSYMMYNRS